MSKLKKAERKAYHKGRKEGFDRGFNTAKMIYNEVVVDLIRQNEALNAEIVNMLSEDDNGISETDTETD